MESFLCKTPKIYSFIRLVAGSKDWEKKTFIESIKPGWSVIEIGANQGYFTSLFQKLVGRNGIVHAFEPIPSTFKLLEKSVASNPRNCFLHNLGSAEKNLDLIEFYLPANDSGQATMSPHTSDSWQNQEIHKVVCKVVRLDDFKPIKSLKKINFIKIDAEGAELPSLKGAKTLLAKHKPILFFEGCKEWMNSFGYTPREIDQFLQSLNYNNLQVVEKKPTRIHSLENFFNNKSVEASFNFLAKES